MNQVHNALRGLVELLDRLILLKLVAHRPRDMADIGDVLFTQGQLDEAYLRRWAEELNVAEELDRVPTEAS